MQDYKSHDVVTGKILVQCVPLIGVGIAGRERGRWLAEGEDRAAAMDPVLLDI